MSPDNSITIRDGRLEDAASVAAILRDTGWFEHLNNETAADTAARVTAVLGAALANDQNALLVAEDGNERVVGYLFAHWLPNALSGSEAYISELFVFSSARGQGVGTALLDTVKQRAIQRGCSRLMLFNRKERESYRRRFYHNQGWVERDDTAMLMYYLEA
jgi:GNAT superfamily N-acetyltransferase